MTNDLAEYGPVLTVEDVSTILGICNNSVYDLLHKGELAGFLKKRHWFIPKSAIEKFLYDNAFGAKK